MDSLSPITILFVAIPEGLLLALTGLTIMEIYPSARPLCKTILLSTIAVIIIRRLPVPPGIHMLLMIFILAGLLMKFYSLPFKKGFPAAFIGFLLLTITEVLFIPRFMAVYSVTMQDIFANPWLRVAASLPQHLTLLVIFVVTYRLRGFHKLTAGQSPKLPPTNYN